MGDRATLQSYVHINNYQNILHFLIFSNKKLTHNNKIIDFIFYLFHYDN